MKEPLRILLESIAGVAVQLSMVAELGAGEQVRGLPAVVHGRVQGGVGEVGVPLEEGALGGHQAGEQEGQDRGDTTPSHGQPGTVRI